MNRNVPFIHFYINLENFFNLKNFKKYFNLTQQVNQLAYEIPKNKYASNPWNYAPEFLKVPIRFL